MTKRLLDTVLKINIILGLFHQPDECYSESPSHISRKCKPHSIANRKPAPSPQVMLIIVETAGTLVRKIQVCLSPLDGAIINLLSVCGGQIILGKSNVVSIIFCSFPDKMTVFFFSQSDIHKNNTSTKIPDR